ncbi:hypothetical protein Tco_1088351, partial [Tanacetum coccineum]
EDDDDEENDESDAMARSKMWRATMMIWTMIDYDDQVIDSVRRGVVA